MGKISANYLLIVAGAIWFIAGINVANLGVQAYLKFEGLAWLWLALGAIVVFAMFFRMFRKMVAKHTKRILAYQNQKTSIFNFFDLRGYIIMGIMMTAGFGLRALGVFPDVFVAFFYTGLGCALALCGVLFIGSYMKLRSSPRQESPAHGSAEALELTSDFEAIREEGASLD